MEQYLIDTNVVSDYFSASFPATGMSFMDTVVNAIPNISIITQIELLCRITGETTTLNVQNFITDSTVLHISPQVILQCVALRRGTKIKTPDAIIAATALANGFALITNNQKDFAGIEGLQIVNPHQM